MSIVFETLREDVAAAISDAHPDVFTEADAIDGPASLAELVRRSPRLPALLVSTPGDRAVSKIANSPVYEVALEAYVVVRGSSEKKRGRACLALAHLVRHYLAETAPTFGGSGPPTEVSRRSLYSIAIDEWNAAVQVVQWKQQFSFEGLTADDLQDLLGFDMTFDLDMPGAGDPVPLPNVADDVDVEP